MKCTKIAVPGVIGFMAFCWLGLAANQAQANNLIVNGSFEADNFNGPGGQVLGLVGAAVTGWNIPSGDGTYPWGLHNGNQYGAGPAPDGQQWVILGEVNTGVGYSIEQTLTNLSIGSTYQLGFEIASELNNASQIQVSFPSGSATPSANFTAPVTASIYWDTWQTFTYNFVPNATSTTIRFTDLIPAGSYDVGLDNVMVTAIPEPSTILMAALGALGLLLATRRGRRA